MPVKMLYCMECGTRLQEKYLASEGRDIPWCPRCQAYRFPVFSTAVSVLLLSPDEQKLLLIRQYDGKEYILPAGYVNKGEDAEHAVAREVREELSLTVKDIRFNHSRYFPPSNTLMLNFRATAESEDVHLNDEVQAYAWFDFAQAERQIRQNSLAQAFLKGWLHGTFDFPEQPAPPYHLD